MVMKYVQLSADQIEEVIHLWNQELGHDFPMRLNLLRQNTFGAPNVLKKGTLAAVNEEHKILGFIFTKKYSENKMFNFKADVGWIQMILVTSRFRKKGIGSDLLQRAERALLEEGVKKIVLGKDPRHYFPGIPSIYEGTEHWFNARGYQFDGTEYDLLTNQTIDLLPSREDASFSLLQENEKQALMNFLHCCFPGRWEYETQNYFDSGGTGREFVVLKKKEKIAGFCRINDSMSPEIAQNVYWAPLFSDGLGGIGPLGIAPLERKHGYGLSIVQAGIATLSSRGIRHFVIDWTQLVDFYKKIDAHPWKIYHCYSKRVGGS